MTDTYFKCKPNYIFYNKKENYSGQFINFPEVYGENTNIQTYSDNGYAPLFIDEKFTNFLGYVTYTDNTIIPKDLNINPVFYSHNTVYNFYLSTGVINTIGSGINDIDLEGWWTKPSTYTIIGGTGKFLHTRGEIVVEIDEVKDIIKWAIYLIE